MGQAIMKNKVHVKRNARMKRPFLMTQGTHETQMSDGAEASLVRSKDVCEKNPGHSKFIPIELFNINCLPEDYQDEDLYEFINVVADLTVRIDVKMTSPRRPKFWPNTKTPYPFSNCVGNAKTRTGSGEMDVIRYINGRGINPYGERRDIVNEIMYQTDYKTCPCETCLYSDKPNSAWWEILVHTARHVVFDNTEARHSSCRLFYDRQYSPIVKLSKSRIDFAKTDEDKCVLIFPTCDTSLGDKLYNTAMRWWDLSNKVPKKYREKPDSRLTFIVSHPHGCTKQVSFGQCVNHYQVSEVNEKFCLTKMTYTACTCPGSSGACVYCVGIGSTHNHSGAVNSELGYSGVGVCDKF